MRDLRLKRVCCLALLAGLLGSLGGVRAEDAPARASSARTIDRLMQQYHELGQFNGSVLISTAGEALLERGYGFANKEWQMPNDGRTRHRVGSITKSFTAALVVQLAEEGKLDLDQSIGDYLADDPRPAITLRQLLTHTDGIPSYTWSASFWQGGAAAVPLTAKEFVREYCSALPDFPSGDRYRYGNSGFSILGAIIEAVTGKTFAAVLREKLLDPAGMSDSGVESVMALLRRRADGYERTVGGYRHADPIPMPLFAAGSMVSTAEDLLRWDQALYRNDVLSAGVRQILLESRPGAVEGTFAYGWNVGELTLEADAKPLRYTSTNGEINGFNALLLRLLDGRHTIVLLNNTGETQLVTMAENILRVLYDLPVAEPEPRLIDRFFEQLATGSVSEAVEFYRSQRASNPDDYLFFPWPVRMLGQQMLREGKTALAATLLELNAETHPADARTQQLLAEVRRRREEARE